MTILFLVTFLFFLYVRPYEFVSLIEAIKVTKVSIILAFIASFFESFERRIVWKDYSFLCFLGLQILAVALLPFSMWRANSLDFLATSYWKTFIAFYLLVIVINCYKRFNIIINSIFLSIGIVAFRAIQAFYNHQFVIDSDGSRRVVGVSTLSSSNPNDIALTFAMIIPLGLSLISNSNGILKKIYFTVITVIICIALIYTGSRGGYLGFAVGVIVFYILKYKNNKMKLFLSICMLGLIISLLLPQEYKSRFLSSFDTTDYSYADQSAGRLAIWQRGLQSLTSRPFGVGINNSYLAEGEQKNIQGLSGRWNVIHNSYIQVGVDLGVTGLLLYLLFIFSGLVNVNIIVKAAKSIKDYKSVNYAYAFAGSISSFMVSSLFLSQAYYWNHYILIALTAGLKNTLINEVKHSND